MPMRKETKVFWCVDYPRLKDSLRLRLHRVRDYLKEQVGGGFGFSFFVLYHSFPSFVTCNSRARCGCGCTKWGIT